jgi:hypothetical protein
MKKSLILVLLTFLSAYTFAQKETEKTTPVTGLAVPAKLDESLLIKETEHNFGKIPQGKPVTYDFTVVNTGLTALKIENVQASCGCTTPSWDRENAIDPKKESKITVGYNAAAEGPFTKLVTITYNGSQTKQITIKGEVWKTPSESAPANTGVNELKN